MQTAIENSQNQKTILWVDDEEIALEAWSQMLQKLGYAVLQARYGIEALEIFKKRKNSISLVILDMRMPGMNGCEVYDRIKKMQPDVKIIIVSGYMEEYDLCEIATRNFDGHVSKPFKLKELSEKIEEVLGTSVCSDSGCRFQDSTGGKDRRRFPASYKRENG